MRRANSRLVAPQSASVGQYFRVKEVDANGVVTAVEAVDAPSGGSGADSGQNVTLSTAQINALHGMFKVCLFDDTKDVDGAISAFETAFGIAGGGEVPDEPDQPDQPDQPGGGSGGTTGDALPTDGLMAYFDLRNLGEKANVTVGTTKGVMATQGSGALFSWTDQPITSSDEYGVKTNRQMMFSAEGNTTQTDLGTEFTVISFGFGECIGPGIQATNIDPRWQFVPSYNKADGTANVTGTGGSALNGDNMKDYNYAVYRVSGASLTLINDTSRKDYNGNDYEGFVSWDSEPTVGRTHYGNGYGTAVAIYNRALSDVEIEEARAFMKTLEVTA
jgi:hypothetical protein